jgi:glycosyltransferase involved in cell wall biosynthesis
MLIADILYSRELNVYDPETLLKKHSAATGHHLFLAEKTTLHIIRHFNGSGEIKKGKASYHFFKGAASRFWLPFRQHRFVNRLKPDVIIVHGFFNPLQLLLLICQTNAKIILQYHSGGQPGRITGSLQKLANRYISDYIFTSAAQAVPFVESGFIPSSSHIHEIMEGSNNFRKLPGETLTKLRTNATTVFLWVGNLNDNKDPLTILAAFAEVFKQTDAVKLLMIYKDEYLLEEAKRRIGESEVLKKIVTLVGKVNHEKIEEYYSAADYFVLGSHHEGSGYALCEAMACGCIPIVTDIPSFKMMTDNGSLGALWECGNQTALISAVKTAMQKPVQQESEKCIAYFQQELSFGAIAEKTYLLCCRVAEKAKE